ncbi:2-oxoacid:acceptor oxidoreductase subunit alpha [Candidatus Bathyarchaeota archaeon]|nr:2-oxoacid:acceptor oxidoreductase subunit alpha [Candidatus Bathyarchaeota archaeon]
MKCTGLHDDTVSIIVGGEAGQGISRSGMLLGKALMRAGFHCFGEIDYPSLIRGGHNFYRVRASGREVYSQTPHTDLVVALNEETVSTHLDSVNEGGGVVLDERQASEEVKAGREDVNFYSVPMTDIVKELGGPDIMRNTVALGATAALIGLDIEILKEVVAETFAGRKNIVEMNTKAIQRGWSHVSTYDYGFGCTFEPGERPDRIWLTGNEAVALGAVAAGCRFYSAYPMTPASPVLHYLMAHDEESDLVVVQTESEISAMMMAVGAGYAGVRSMTSTSGGGFCLMTESLSMAAMTETPVVVMLGQRPGPSTGLATYSAQGDLLFAVYGAHGEFQRVVLAPGDVDQCYNMTAEAFNLAERFQIPVIVLTDKNVIESHKTTAPFTEIEIDRGKLVEEWSGDEEYLRYKITDDGVSPRALPGTLNALVLANSNEHVERGFVTSQPEPVKEMVDKRFRKAPHIREAVGKLKPLRVYGSDSPDVTIVGWGSSKGPALEAIAMLGARDVKARYVQVAVMEPFPEGLMGYLGGAALLLENNRTAQLGTLIKLNTGHVFKHIALRYDGRPFTPDEVRNRALEVL